MPELPEVEVVRGGLESLVQGNPVIIAFEFRRADLRDSMPIRELKALVGAQVLSVVRRAKYLIFETTKGNILSHLGMTGTWRNDPAENLGTHDHLLRRLSNGVTLVYRDPRRFGIFEMAPIPYSESPRIKNLGPEPLGEAFTAQGMWAQAQGKKIAVKTFIMDQKNVVGVGNIYAAEALFLAGIKPTRKVSAVKREEWKKLTVAIQKVLRKAIQAGGSSIQDFKSATESSGYFQMQFKVYGREGEPCSSCGSPIRAKIIGGRNSFWCASCQK